MKNWKQLARASGLEIPESDLDRIAASLEDMEAKFQPLVARIPHDAEPPLIFKPEAQ